MSGTDASGAWFEFVEISGLCRVGRVKKSCRRFWGSPRSLWIH